MLRSLALASILAFGTAGAALAQDAGPVMTGGGDNLQITYPQGNQNIVGGAYATVQGGGDNQQVATSSVAHVQQNGVMAVLTGGGDNMQIVYVPVSPSTSMLAQERAQGAPRSPRG